ncbi:MAG: Hsp20 family protein [Solirubrobacteraceae bacterium]
MHNQGNAGAFIPPADLLIDADGVNVYTDVSGLHSERGFGRFERSIRVPRGLDPDAIEASLSDGVLTLRIPKPETMRPRRIEIKGSENGAREHEGATA